MKCVKKGSVVIRVTEQKADQLKKDGWKLATKTEWRKGGRLRK